MIVHFVDHNINDIEIICLCEFHVEIILIHIDMEIKCYHGNKLLSRNECYEFMIVIFVDHNIIDIEIKSFM